MPGMEGCAGAVTQKGRSSPCSSAAHVCTLQEWFARRGTTVPTQSYWLDEENARNVTGANQACAFSSVGTQCIMHVCPPNTGPQNPCTYKSECGFVTAAPNEYLGCSSPIDANDTAATLCCAP